MNTQHLNGETAISELETATVSPKVSTPAYEAPAVESVVTFDNMQREVLYAGTGMTAITPTP